jgi:NAD(P)-dependent dehydrogenase (short-subunit alcohol dehydrogenase family)
MKNKGYNFRAYPCDVANYASAQECISQITKDMGPIDVLVNNAGITRDMTFKKMDKTNWDAVIQTNLDSVFNMTKPVCDGMTERGWGRIINIGSMAVSLEPIGDSVYAACKAGLTTLANVMAKELAPLNITCNTLSITAIKTDMLLQLPQDKVDAVIAGLSIPRYAEPDDIFNIVDFLASERSSYITAQTIYMGGVN